MRNLLLSGVFAALTASAMPPLLEDASQDSFSLANETVCEQIPLGLRPRPGYNRSEHNPIVNLFKRGCTLPQGITCADQDPCCNDPNDNGNGWCCPAGVLCADGVDSTYCAWSTIFVTSTTTEYDYITNWNSYTESEAGTTEWETITSTNIITISESNVDTQTEVQTVTVTRRPAKRAERTKLPWMAPSTSASAPTFTPSVYKQQQPMPPRVTPPPQPRHFGFRNLFPRQDQELTTLTSTSMVTERTTLTTSADTTLTSYYSVTSTSTEVSTITFTSAIDAETTVTSTFTLTVDPGSTFTLTVGPGETSSAAVQQETKTPAAGGNSGDSGGGGGLSIGAKAGIGAGVGAVALFALLLLAFCLYRRRKNKQMQTALATAATPPPAAVMVEDRKSPAGRVYSPPPSSYHSGMIPVPPSGRYGNQSPDPRGYGGSSPPPAPGGYGGHSPTGSTPAPAYQYPSPDEARHEMYARGMTPQAYGMPPQPGLEVGQQQFEMAGYASPAQGHAMPFGYQGQEQTRYGGSPEMHHPRPN
ncbi:hypothetical protein EJ04DRAFT_556499 [Polyplosphaeria fusca]|uniref:Uncharacterized protein n=1 Tax=Polyplosphaeria fusca TaxID=682080 RepID=A0A9P4QM09_9PLEO|nr:hypothetical protein EJ04DRAFT_556499 [Polyplosphaeria fusca]